MNQQIESESLLRRGVLSFCAAALAALMLTVTSGVLAQTGAAHQPTDARVGLRAGWMDAEMAAQGLELIANAPRPAGFFNPSAPGDLGLGNSDLAFSGNYVFQGNFNGIQVWDVTDPAKPKLRASIVCPGGQGDVSVYGNLLFMSVEETRARIDCGTREVVDSVSVERFRGVRIFDISRIDAPRQVAAVQTCRGSHTHTLVPDPRDDQHVYVYVSGTGPVRSPSELEGCSSGSPQQNPNTALFQIEIISVPLARPEEARVINAPRIFADRATGDIAGLWRGGAHGPGTQSTSATTACHDITVYPEIGLAAGACSGNGILLDIRDPASPVRIHEVVDPNFAYWHSATFSNDGRKVIFTDEWGGGWAARCRASDRPEWGANALFEIVDGKLQLAGYYKLPSAQSALENCVAHNGSLIPVPGRDIKVQGWYQGGISVFDFTDPARPVEIAFFDRGPISAARLEMGGHWSAYWYNGRIYGSEISRGLDVLRLVPSEHLSANEIAAAELVRMDVFNAQHQTTFTWPASFVVARAYVDQLMRGGAEDRRIAEQAADALDRAERASGSARRSALTQLADRLEQRADAAEDASRVQALAAAVRAF